MEGRGGDTKTLQRVTCYAFLAPDILQPVILFLFIYLFIYLLICLFNLFAQCIFHLVAQLMRNQTGKK